MKRINIEFEGQTPLLMNRLTPEELETLRTKERKKFTAPKDPRETANKKVYQTEDGAPYLPVENLMSCLIHAGCYIKLDGKRQMSTAKSTLLPGFLAIEDHMIKLDAPNGWEVDMRQGRNPNGGEAVCIVRPRFNTWKFKCSMMVDDQSISLQTIRELIDKAGSLIGLGDFRPSKKGVFGKFKVTGWKEAA